MNIRAVARRGLAAVLVLFPSRLSGISILMYHSISESRFLADTPRDFDSQMRYIKDAGFRTVFASEVPDLLEQGDTMNTVCITLDDGYLDNYTNALPILERYGLKATIFVISGLVGKHFTNSWGERRDLLRLEDIETMKQSGLIEFMPHSHTHPEFDSLKMPRIEEEILASRSWVRAVTGIESTVFAYPRGKYNDETIDMLKRCGFSAAFGVEPGLARKGMDPFRLPRNSLGAITHKELQVKLSDRLETYLKIKNFL